MAARRLIFVMIVMLMLSSFAAALVPVRDDEDDTSTSTTAAAPKRLASEGRTVEKRIDAAAKESKTIRIALGDHLVLEVASNRAGTVEIPALGELEDVEPGTPAHFDLLPYRESAYDVRMVGSGRLLGQIVVTPPPPENEKRGRKRNGKPAGERATRV